MRLIFLNSRLSDKSGADRWLLDIVASLQGKAETLMLFSRQDADMPTDELRRIGPARRLKGLDTGGIGRRVTRGCLEKLEDAIRNFGPDVIHSNDVVDPAVLDLIAVTGKAVVTVQDHRFFCPGPGKALPSGRICNRIFGPGCGECLADASYLHAMLDLTLKRLEAAKKAAAVITLSEYMAKELVRVGVDKARILVIPPIVKLPWGLGFQDDLPSGSYHLLACRLVRHKGVRVALEAASLLATGTRLVVAGDGPLQKEVKEAASFAGSGVRFLGWLEHGEFWKILHGALSLWMPSTWIEPFGIVGLEAGFAGVPVLAPLRGGVSDWLLPGKTGLEIGPGDAVDLAAKADYLESNPAERLAMGLAAQTWLQERFDPFGTLARLMTLYQGFGPGF
ncbi:MAG: glycosyltransferase family 4 protein [Deltaproteobacteria bacterium]|nr:glycosyltransferase family 4 protein [Deltaproteobacteria bacterium]